MNREELQGIHVSPIDRDLYNKIKLNWDHIAKPLNGLGDFEEITCRIGAITHDPQIDISKRAVVMMCADNGVVEEGISQSDSSVTSAVTSLMGQGLSSVCKMAKTAKVDTIPVDIGVSENRLFEGVYDYKVTCGTKNFLREQAMSETETESAISVGIELVKKLKADGYKMIATGEMGIGNTTTSAAVIAAILQLEPGIIAGRGAGLSDKGLDIKIQVIQTAIDKYGLRSATAFDVLRHVGGLDIAGLCGVFIGGAMYEIPIVIDGLISAAAALVAEKLVPGVKEYMIASHLGKELGMKYVLDFLGLTNVISAGLALGEGTGAIMLFPLLDMALSLYSGGVLFSETEVEQYERFT